jgi:hypothetical protein
MMRLVVRPGRDEAQSKCLDGGLRGHRARDRRRWRGGWAAEWPTLMRFTDGYLLFVDLVSE